ncbi:MAG TPA: DUF535 family protein [Noviherbaspirillum sp.]
MFDKAINMFHLHSSDTHHNILSWWKRKHTHTLTVLKEIFKPAFRLIPSVIKKRGIVSVRACFRFASILGNLSGHKDLFEAITHPRIIGLTKRHPRLGYRYVAPYLARCFDRNTRLDIITNHYRYLSNQVNTNILACIYDENPVIWKECIDGQLFCITLSFPKEHDYEGELRLTFQAASVSLYSVVLTIAPGRSTNLQSGQVLLISAVQGTAGKIDLIRQATKICHGSAPIYLLLAATEAFALSLDIDTIVGMSANQQIARQNKTDCHSFFDYDGFWMDFTEDLTMKDFYPISVPLSEKPLSTIKSNRRSRALRRRYLKKQIFQKTQTWIRKNF